MIHLALAVRSQPYEDERGVVRIDGQEMLVVDRETGEPVSFSGLIWGPGKILMTCTCPDCKREECDGDGLWDERFFEAEEDYLVLVVRCPSATKLEPRRKGVQ